MPTNKESDPDYNPFLSDYWFLENMTQEENEKIRKTIDER